MDIHIINLLKTNNRVIIPEFGAFIVKSGSPRTIVFNEFLKYNDEILVKEVSKAENITEDEASNKLDEFTRELNSQLNIGQQHKLGTLGILKKDKNGRVHFEMLKGEEEKEEEIKKESVESKSKEITPIELDIVKSGTKDIKNDVKKEELKKEETKKEERKEEEPPKEPELKKRIDPAAAKKEEKPLTVNEKLKIKTTATGGIKRTPPPVSEDKKGQKAISIAENKKSKNLVWYGLVGVILIAIAIWFFVNKEYLFNSSSKTEKAATTKDQVIIKPEAKEQPEDGKVPGEESKKEEQAPSQSSITEESKADVKRAEKTSARENASNTSQKRTGGKRYYIVAGCFQMEDNADKYVSYLNTQGYNSEKFGKYGGLFAVSFDSFSSYNEAQKELRKIKASTEPGAWILYY